MYNNVAEEILAQLGGRVFIKMTGVKNLRTTNGDNLIMTLPRNSSGANEMEIALDVGTDTYNVRFLKRTKPHLNVKTCAFIGEKVKVVKSFTLINSARTLAILIVR